jgi:hypothetical protein
MSTENDVRRIALSLPETIEKPWAHAGLSREGQELPPDP